MREGADLKILFQVEKVRSVLVIAAIFRSIPINDEALNQNICHRVRARLDRAVNMPATQRQSQDIVNVPQWLAAVYVKILRTQVEPVHLYQICFPSYLVIMSFKAPVFIFLGMLLISILMLFDQHHCDYREQHMQNKLLMKNVFHLVRILV